MEAILFLFLNFVLLFPRTISSNNSVQINGEPLFDNHNKGPKPPINGEQLLFVSTLDGQLNAVNKRDGEVLWSIQEGPILKMSKMEDRGLLFLASPIDGSLYSFRLGNEGINKLPFTIPDLVSISPSRGEDGALYTGHKRDSWISVDLQTGNKHQILDSEGIHEICPSSTPSTIFIGRTEYSVNLYDKNSGKITWNATFTHYTSHLSLDTSTFGMKHFASSSDGFLVTMNAETGAIAWTQKFDSLIVGIYSISKEGAFISCPFHSMGLETLQHLSEKGLVGSEWADKFSLTERFKDSFLPTLYIGRSGPSSYALLSFVDASLVSVSPKSFGRPLLEGPEPIKGNNKDCTTPPANENHQKMREGFLIGHHEVPNPPKMYVRPMGMLEDTSRQLGGFARNETFTGQLESPRNMTSTVVSSGYFDWLEKYLHVFVLTIIMALLIVIIIQNKNHRTNNKQQQMKRDETTPEQHEENFVTGKITYNKKEILGTGCQGTIVFKGQFEKRDVAVKRILTEFVDVARTEIDLLQVSDHHGNVVRYFCTESDSQFFYIALELCPRTLHDLITVDQPKNDFVLKDIILQMLSGIKHLHSLNIVHRDIKPQNVLLTETKDNKILIKISDFGLCRRIASENSFYSKTGSVGTMGWIAPEVIDTNCQRASKAVDIFSSGLVIYYILTCGLHPFGDANMRQNNIIEGKYDLGPLKCYHDAYAARDIIKEMISNDPSQRPSVEFVHKHPTFWTNERALKFIQVVSDRLEKLPNTDESVCKLDRWPNDVIKKDWTKCINPDLLIGADSKKYRSYCGSSIRDLNRFIRNKGNHYREIPPKLKEIIGSLPDGYMIFFIRKFPALIMHTHEAMNCLKDEEAFKPFY